MSTIVYQELLQSSYSNNNESRTLNLKLINSSKNSKPSNSSNFGGWISIEDLPSQQDTKVKDETIYVHPLVKRSSFMLSEKSLKMCTENLGCETGTCDTDSISNTVCVDKFFSSSSSSSSSSSCTKTMIAARKPRQKFDIRKELSLSQGKFPPPLTTITGSSTIQVKPYREDGRLVIEAVSTPPIQSYMQAERSEGRLKLSMLKEMSYDIVQDDDNNNKSNNILEDGFINDQNIDENVIENHKEEQQEKDNNVEEEEFECSKGEGTYLLEDMNGIKVEYGGKLGMGKIQRMSRCKERGQGNKILINWEPFWVAT